MQCYAAALARHDLASNVEEPAFALAAFDLDAADPVQVALGLHDLDAFFSPLNHVHTLVPAMPTSWRNFYAHGLTRLTGLCSRVPV